MAPSVPEEVDVFTIPHSRMKGLVNDYFDMVHTAFLHLFPIKFTMMLHHVVLALQISILASVA